MTSLRSRFRSVLLGALIGDCVGLDFEGAIKVPFSVLEKHISRFQKDQTSKLPYSDDSAMTLALSEALLENKNNSHSKLGVLIAQSFQAHFIKSPDRGYGPGAAELMPTLLSKNPDDPFFEAAQMFNGTGSYGNGAAMRVSPVALYCSSISQCLEVCRLQARVTHAHSLGINGALMQVVSIKLALKCEKGELDKFSFLDEILNEAREFESDVPTKTRSDTYVRYYSNIIATIKHYLREYQDQVLDAPKMITLRTELGNEVSAHRSVPMALFMFLFTLNREFTFENTVTGAEQTLPPFCNAIAHCIAVGGDTDTIASMCGALCGAYYGCDDDAIPSSWINACEASEQFIAIADQLYKLTPLCEP